MGSNMFAYCNNNPVNMVDSNGYDPLYNVAMTDGGDGSSNSAVYAAYLLHKYPYPSEGKMLSSAAGCAFLGATGLKATKATYCNGIWGDGALLSNEGKAEVIKALRESDQMNAIIKDAVRSANGPSFFESDTVIFGAGNARKGLDLYLSIHNASYILQGKKCGNYWIVAVTLYDQYDFEYWDKEGHTFIARTVNNFGYSLQENGLIDPYYLHVTYTVIWR